TNLCVKYLKKIIKQKRIDQIIDSLMNEWGIKNDFYRNLFFELFINAIVFHDIGKINPQFQLDKMNNDLFKNIESERNYQSKHSLLSAHIYIEYYKEKVIHLPKDIRIIMLSFIYLNAFVISRHHSQINDYEKNFINEINSANEIDKNLIKWFNKNLKSLLTIQSNIQPINKDHRRKTESFFKNQTTNNSVNLYLYVRLLHSLVVACDYYATSEFKNRKEVKMADFQFDDIIDAYSNNPLVKKIRTKKIDDFEGINKLRTKIYLETENNLLKNLDKNIFYLEAPTGSGKSNTALNLSLQLVNQCKNLNKIIYVYPFNTLVEQNIENLTNCFQSNDIMKKVAVVNSVTPIKIDEEASILYSKNEKYQQALLDRQFLNYPIILTTHVSLFDTMFGNNRESSFGFYQLANSVIVLDEIQNYRINIWSEMIVFLKQYTHILNLKIIIMSATLPNLELLAFNDKHSVHLINDKNIYYQNKLFKDRVKLDYHLLKVNNIEERLFIEVCQQSLEKKKIMIEFIKRETANKFYQRLKKANLGCEVLFISGSDSILERKRIIEKVKKSSHLILIATQVVEAGIDIDMDIGYKDISKLDSEEQLLGRINRSCKKEGIVYFFNLDDASKIYKNDERVQQNVTLQNEECKKILESKSFDSYYEKLLNNIKQTANEDNDNNLQEFFRDSVATIKFTKVAEKMNLILDTRDCVSIYLATVIKDIDGQVYDGRKIWQKYEELLLDNDMDYSKKVIELSKIKSIMNYFIFRVGRNSRFDYDKQIGDLFYIDDGEKYMKYGKLNMSIFDTGKELYI
ncbi:CRISPR-associated helicase Cas3', partial [Thomasclavelia sp.]|uniref:CRISPR-associated helicase Cas3' n=1 Tax=Thomasclavelia sp. TaxID=3025757 RepID=UPI0025FABC81